MKFETDKDRANEESIKQVIERKWKCELVKQPKEFSIDYIAYSDGCEVAIIEVKKQRIPFTKYNTMMTPSKKRQAAMRIAAKRDVKAIQVIQYADSIRWVDMFMPICKKMMIQDHRYRDSTDYYECVFWDQQVVHRLK